jgi:hypothetical protein
MDCRQLVRLGDYAKHKDQHRGNMSRGWSARNRSEQRRFRNAVLKRDGYRCTLVVDGLRCEATEQLVAHHNLPLHKGGSFEPAGGVTLCEQHHRDVDSYAR